MMKTKDVIRTSGSQGLLLYLEPAFPPNRISLMHLERDHLNHYGDLGAVRAAQRVHPSQA